MSVSTFSGCGANQYRWVDGRRWRRLTMPEGYVKPVLEARGVAGKVPVTCALASAPEKRARARGKENMAKERSSWMRERKSWTTWDNNNGNLSHNQCSIFIKFIIRLPPHQALLPTILANVVSRYSSLDFRVAASSLSAPFIQGLRVRQVLSCPLRRSNTVACWGKDRRSHTDGKRQDMG